MRVFIGVDLGSTTTKALILDDAGEVVGRGITNSRSNYNVAVAIARAEAFIETLFNLLARRLRETPALADVEERLRAALKREFRMEQHLQQLAYLRKILVETASDSRYGERASLMVDAIARITDTMVAGAPKRFRFSRPPTEFFRDLASGEFLELAQAEANASNGAFNFDTMAGVFDKAILKVENRGLDLSFSANITPALERCLERFSDKVGERASTVWDLVMDISETKLDVASSVGTGYGRARLPFPKKQIRSEILCHGLGAHTMFGATRTVLDIGGQDTKAIQVDADGIVTSFQMNDRCAAGCGRYLGYIADEMNLGLHELGPLADRAQRSVKINSTCTVFAGAELRDRLTMGQKREDILAGLHRAIILRAMSLLARSGGVANELTFTGGVARNSAAVKALRALVKENYGDVTLNISEDSICTGALGAAIFAWRTVHQEGMAT
ncbi:MAG: BadF/BadG/BcrA/BcrD ATPase family protein [Myxococcota bacterium]|jgi:benzoyl-CoA reductase subunit A|nr:BadF/BadG/BcrA/BcrD ATPase family protein [Myxococcota bacterium]